MNLATIPNVEIFQVGQHGGEPWTEADLLDMARNAVKFNNRQKAVVKIGHDEQQPAPLADGSHEFGDDGGPAFGQVPNPRVEFRFVDGFDEPVATLVGDCLEVPNYLADMIAQGVYRRVSAEIDPDAGSKEGLEGARGPMLKAVSFLGGSMPAVKTLADVKDILDKSAGVQMSEYRPRRLKYAEVQRNDAGSVIRVFSEVKTMATAKTDSKTKAFSVPPDDTKDKSKLGDAKMADGGLSRDALVAALGQAGFDTSVISDAMPDNVLAEMLRCMEAKSNMADQSKLAPQPDVVAHADKSGDDTVSLNYSEDIKVLQAETAKANSEAKKANEAAQEALKFAEQSRSESKKQFVEAKVTAMVAAGKVAPAEVEGGLVTRLLRRDHVKKFSESQMTELEEELAALDKREPIIKFSQRTKSVTTTSVDAETEKVRKFSEDQADTLKRNGKPPTFYVDTFKKLQEKDPTITAEKAFGIKA